MNTTEMLSCCIKYWEICGKINFSATYWRLCQQIGTYPALATIHTLNVENNFNTNTQAL
jgi:hypothetical protein